MKIADYKNTNLMDKPLLKTIEIEDYENLAHYYSLRRPETSDSNLLALYLWKECYPTWYFTNDLGLMWVAQSEDGSYYSAIPCCKKEDIPSCFLETQRYFNEVLNKKLTMYVVDKEAVDILNLSEEDYVVVRDRSYDDYIYDAEKLRTLSGRKYHKKKNHLNSFKKSYQDRYEFKILDCSNRKEVLDFLKRWIENKEEVMEKEYIDYEAKGVEYILEHCDTLEFKVGGVYIDGVLEAFTIGSYYSKENMAYICVEKANASIKGLYAYINSEFLKVAFPNAAKVNREDDMGLLGLRQAKMSYNPIYMVEKYTIIQK